MNFYSLMIRASTVRLDKVEVGFLLRISTLYALSQGFSMFAFLRGVISSKDVAGNTIERLVLDVSGVGFEMWMAGRALANLGRPGDEVTVHTWMSVRETELTLFGFQSAEERKLFQLLQTVSGVGPRLALAKVGTLGVSGVVDAVLAEDKKSISQTPGVGPKVAQRIVLELRSKIEEFSGKLGAAGETINFDTDVSVEVRAILENLGYTGTEVAMALKRAREDELPCEDVESVVRYSLKVLGSAG